MGKEMGMKGVSFYIFAALANKHRAMKQPVTAQGPEYTLATDDDVKIRRVASIRVKKEPNNPWPFAQLPCVSHAVATRLPRATFLYRRGGLAATGVDMAGVSPLQRATEGKPLSFDPIWRRIQHIRKAPYHSPLSAFSHNKIVTMSGNSEVEYLKSLVSQVRPASFHRTSFNLLLMLLRPAPR